MRFRTLLLPLLLLLPACGREDPGTAPDVVALDTPQPAVLAPYALSQIPLPAGYSSGSATGINASGLVVGTASNGPGSFRAFYNAGNGSYLLPIPANTTGGSHAWGTNDRGWIVGQVGTRAAFWTSVTAQPFLIPLPNANYGFGIAYAVNNQGLVTGEMLQGLDPRAFRWSAAGGTVVMLPPGATISGAYAVNDAGEIAGRTSFDGLTVQAGRWLADGSYYQLPLPSGGSLQGINSAGMAVGGMSLPNGNGQAIVHTFAGGVVNLTNNYAVSEYAIAISDHGRVIGVTGDYAHGWTRYPATGAGQELTRGTYTAVQVSGINLCGTVVGTAVRTSGTSVPVRWVKRACD